MGGMGGMMGGMGGMMGGGMGGMGGMDMDKLMAGMGGMGGGDFDGDDDDALDDIDHLPGLPSLADEDGPPPLEDDASKAAEAELEEARAVCGGERLPLPRAATHRPPLPPRRWTDRGTHALLPRPLQTRQILVRSPVRSYPMCCEPYVWLGGANAPPRPSLPRPRAAPPFPPPRFERVREERLPPPPPLSSLIVRLDEISNTRLHERAAARSVDGL